MEERGLPRRMERRNSPVFKKGEREMVKNCRGITLMDTGYKIYAEILWRRLEKQMENGILNDTQMGFRRRRRAVDAIAVVKAAIDIETSKERGKLYLFFADMKGAFDRLKREEIWKRLQEEGVDGQLRIRIQVMYDRTICTLRVTKGLIGKFLTGELDKGVR